MAYTYAGFGKDSGMNTDSILDARLPGKILEMDKIA
jgi:hypothetical protein